MKAGQWDLCNSFVNLFSGSKLYSGTVADFSGSDALIIRDRVRTEQYDLKHLNGEGASEGEPDKNGLKEHEILGIPWRPRWATAPAMTP